MLPVLKYQYVSPVCTVSAIVLFYNLTEYVSPFQRPKRKPLEQFFTDDYDVVEGKVMFKTATVSVVLIIVIYRAVGTYEMCHTLKE